MLPVFFSSIRSIWLVNGQDLSFWEPSLVNEEYILHIYITYHIYDIQDSIKYYCGLIIIPRALIGYEMIDSQQGT